jgi:hypothetical protein
MRRRPWLPASFHVWLALVFFGLGSQPQLAFCSDASGHRAIELSDPLCCWSNASPHGVAHADPHCAPDCTDTPLGSVAATGRPHAPQHLAVAHAPAANAAAVIVVVAGAYAPASDNPSWAHPPTPRVLRSTVNRC